MIQSAPNGFVCLIHKKKIVSICLNQTCQKSRLGCFDCLKNNEHALHPNEIEEFEKFDINVEETKLKYNNLITQLNQMIDDILNLYFRLKKGIDDKFNLPIQRINIITNEELIQYIDNMIQFDKYQERIKYQFKSNCQEFEQKLNNCLIELQLDTLTYNVVSQENRQMVQNLYKQGYSLYSSKKDYDGAIKLFDQALSYDRNHLNSIWCKGEQIKCKGLYRDSLEWFEKALSIDAKHLVSLHGKGDSLKMIGQYQDAIQIYDKILIMNSSHVDSLNGKGSCLRKMGFYKEALELQKKALAINPNHKLALYEHGIILSQKNWNNPNINMVYFHIHSLSEFQEALIYLDKALSIDQNHWLSLASKGACLIELQKYDDALV